MQEHTTTSATFNIGSQHVHTASLLGHERLGVVVDAFFVEERVVFSVAHGVKLIQRTDVFQLVHDIDVFTKLTTVHEVLDGRLKFFLGVLARRFFAAARLLSAVVFFLLGHHGATVVLQTTGDGSCLGRGQGGESLGNVRWVLRHHKHE